MSQFYRVKGTNGTPDTLYDASTNNKIADVNAMKAGGYNSEVAAPTAKAGSVAIANPTVLPNYNVTNKIGGTLYGTLKNPTSSDLKVGSNGSPTPPTPTAPTIQKTMAQHANEMTQGANDTLKIYQTQQADIQKQIDSEKANLVNIDKQRQADVTTPYEQLSQPFRQNIEDLNNKKFDVEGQIQKSIDLADELANYGKLMDQELTNEQNTPAMLSVQQGRENNIKDTYTSKIATTQAAMAAIKNNIGLVDTYIDRGVSAIVADRTDRINYLNFVNGLLTTKETDSKNKILTLTTDQKTAVENQIKTFTSEMERVQKNKDTITALMSSPDTAYVTQKAGVLLTDTQDQMAKKLMTFYAKNPQYTSSNQTIIKGLISNYADAGILPFDTLETAYAKMKKSVTYQQKMKDLTKGSTLTEDQKLTIALGMVKDGSASDLADALRQIDAGANGSVKADGSYGGQCGDYIHLIMTGTPTFGDTWQSKEKAMNVSPANFAKNPQVGDILTFKIGANGHVAVVTAVDGDKVTLSESNYKLDEKVSNGRTISVNDQSILGAYRGADFKTGSNNSNSKSADEWATAIKNGSATLDKVPQKDRTAVVTAMNKMPVASESTKTALQTNIDLVDKILNKDDINSVVGANMFGRFSLTNWATGSKETAIADIQKLISNEALNSLIQAKKGGATFGALSDRELDVLSSAATSLASYANKDKNGKVTGYTANQDEFKNELKRLQESYKKLLNANGGELPSEDNGINSYINNLSATANSTSSTADDYLNSLNIK